MAQLKYPLEESSYKLLEEIGSGVSAIVFKAICLPMNSIVAIKAIDLDRSRADFDNIRREAKAMSLLSHPKILKAHCSFTVNRLLWVVMPFMSAGSLQSIINSSFPNGLPEPCIAFVLKEILYALLYLHDQGHLHRDIKAGNILIDSDGSVKLADFGVSASIYESKHTSSISSSSSSSLMLNDVAGTPYWMAPEVIHSHTGYSFKADIWSFGITALELAHGRPPLSHLPPSKSLIMRITSRFLISDYEKHNKEKNKKFSKNFREMVSACLDQDPSKRPTAERLLKHPFFKNCKNADFLVKNVLQGLPTVEERFKKSKVDYPLQSHEESSEEEESQGDGTIVKHRRISGWNFNEQDLEFNPVFPTESEDDSITKRVRFGGESIIHDSESGQKERNNLQTHTTPPTQEETPANGDVGSHYPGPRRVIASQLVSSLTELQRSLEDEKQMVSNLLTNFGGGEADGVVEMSREEQLQKRVEQLTAELEQEKRKNAALEMDVELLRKRYAGAVSSCKNNG